MFRSETALVACSTIFRNWDKQLSVMPVYRPQPSEPGTFVARLRSNMVVNAARRATVVLVFVGIGVSIVIVRFWRPLTIDACVLQPRAPKAVESPRWGDGSPRDIPRPSESAAVAEPIEVGLCDIVSDLRASREDLCPIVGEIDILLLCTIPRPGASSTTKEPPCAS